MNQPVPLVPSPMISAVPQTQYSSSSATMVAETSAYVDSLSNPAVHMAEIIRAKTVAETTKRASPRVNHHNPRNPRPPLTTGGWGLGAPSSRTIIPELFSLLPDFGSLIWSMKLSIFSRPMISSLLDSSVALWVGVSSSSVSTWPGDHHLSSSSVMSWSLFPDNPLLFNPWPELTI